MTHDAKESLKQKGSEVYESVKQKGGEMYESAKGSLKNSTQSAQEMANEAAKRAQDAKGGYSEPHESIAQTVEGKIGTVIEKGKLRVVYSASFYYDSKIYCQINQRYYSWNCQGSSKQG